MVDLVINGVADTDFARYLRPGRKKNVVIDLSDLRFCHPVGLVAIATHAERYLSEGRRVSVVGPSNPDVANYLSRMRLSQVLSTLGAEHQLPRVREHNVEGSLFELTTFDGSRGAAAVAELLFDDARDVGEEVACALYEGLCEAGQNVAHHSGQTRGFMAAQWVRNRQTFRFTVGDSGVGLLSTLRTRGVHSDREALTKAVQKGVSSSGDGQRGMGLYDMGQQLTSLSGTLDLISGCARLCLSRSGQKLHDYELPMEGTIVQGLLHVP